MWPSSSVYSVPLHGRFSSLFKYSLSEEEVPALKAFYKAIKPVLPIGVVERRLLSLKVALDRYNNALLEPIETERKLMMAVMGLEALYTLESDRGEIPFKLGVRTAKLLSLIGHEPIEASLKINKAYSIRNKIAHGSIISEEKRKEVSSLLKDIAIYLRESLVIFALLERRIERGKLIELLDYSLINEERTKELRSLVSLVSDQLPGWENKD